MISTFKKITIIKIRKSPANNINQDIQNFSQSLGLFNVRDKEKSCYRIFVELLKAAKFEQGLSSDELAYKLNLSRGTVIHHLNRLMDSGLVVSKRNKYMLRTKDLASLIEKLKKDAIDFFNDLKNLALDIDKKI
ncbi:transcriptional regulator [Candidatus Woesearchaeota archaeon]|nr:MAG: transcriptional regulator [Candidatus Woesearchaeota archaeon]